MKSRQPFRPGLSEADLDFLLEEAPQEARGRDSLRHALEEDPAARRALLGAERLGHRVAAEGSLLMRLTPALYFEILLRRAQRELEFARHTFERTATTRIPVFDVAAVRELLERPGVIEYLAHMLETFTRVESRSYRVRGRRGVWRRIRYNDTDLDCLLRFCENADEEHRLRYYKRIADVCLFILGVFPQHAPFDFGVAGNAPWSGLPFLPTPRSLRGHFDYEAEGRYYYKLACDHPAARELDVADVFQSLHEMMAEAKKPLNHIAEHYLRFPGTLPGTEA